MTATGSHIDFGFAARSTTLQWKAISLSRKLFRRFITLWHCGLAGGACLARSNFIRRNSGALTLRNQVRTSDLRLPLEGKLAQRQLRLMRSKLPIITIGWYDTVTFDLIRHAKRRDTVVEV